MHEQFQILENFFPKEEQNEYQDKFFLLDTSLQFFHQAQEVLIQ